jgi:DNA transformation protein and related proteins
MPIAPGLLEQIAAQLAALPELAIRRMFGGAGLYSRGVFFGVIDDDRVYFRIGDSNRDDFKRAGSVAFQPIPDKPAMAYFSVPTMVIARSERFVEWAKKAVDAARAAKPTQPKRAKPAPAKKAAPPPKSAKQPTKQPAATTKRAAAPAKKAAVKRRR